ncbi:MAG TPA: glycosyltransferase family 4 protein [Ilumatobacteraceae bacterium]|jgi:glycosyltransferase involved in cell wall biosynthesis
MQIALIAPPWLPVPAPAYGGTEAVLDALAQGLQSAGHDVLMVCHPDSTCPVPKASVIPVEDTVRMGRMIIELEHAIGAYDLVRDVDVVHDHTLAGPVYSSRFPELVVVTTNHNPFSRPYNALYHSVVPRVGVVAISQSHADSTDVPIDAVVHHGIDVDDYPFGAGDGGYVALLGRMAPNKGVHRAIAVARAVGTPLKIAAKMREPHEVQYFEEFVEPHLGGDIEYLGEVDADGKRDLLASAAALLNPISWREPFGMAMLEALACGTPVVGCPQGAAPEIVEHAVTGYLGDSDAELINGLQSLDRIDRNVCRDHARTRFSVERMVEGYSNVYERRLEMAATAQRSPQHRVALA